MKIKITVIVLCFILVSCKSSSVQETISPDGGTAFRTNTLTATSTKGATAIPTEVMTSTETSTPAPPPTLPPIPVPAGAEQLTLENMGKVEVIAWPVKGEILDAYYFPDAMHYAVVTENGTDSYMLGGVHQARVDIKATFSTLSFDGRFLAVTNPYEDNVCRVEVYDVLTGELVIEDQRSIQRIYNFSSAAFSYSNDMVAVACPDFRVTFYDLGSGDSVTPNRTIYPSRMSFSPDGSKLALSNLRGLQVWGIDDLENTELIYQQSNIAGHVSDVSFSPDGKYLLTMLDNFIMLHDLESRINLGKFETINNPYPYAEFTQDGQYILVWENGGVRERWLQPQYRTRLRYFAGAPEVTVYSLDNRQPADGIEFSPQDLQLLRPEAALGGVDGYWAVSRIQPPEEIFVSAGPVVRYWKDGQTAVLETAASGNVYVAAQSALYCVEENLVVHDLATGAVNPLADRCASPYLVAYSQATSAVAFTTANKITEVLSTVSGETVTRLGGTSYPVINLRFSNDGTYLAIATDAPYGAGETIGEILLFQIDYDGQGAEKIRLDIQGTLIRGEVVDLDISLDNNYLVAADSKTRLGEPWGGGYVRIWEVGGDYLRAWHWEDQFYDSAIAISPDNTLLVVGGSRGHLFFYSVETRELVGEIKIAPYPIEQLQFSLDGKSLYVLTAGSVAVLGISE
jgi:WD40 repeat protein